MTSIRTARRDERLSATVIGRAPLSYAAGPDPSLDRPAHVRAASGIALLAGQIAIIQDDSNFVAVVDPQDTGRVRAVDLPAGADGQRQFGSSRGNKHLKLDLEACFSVSAPQPMLVAFASGSTAARESIVLVSGWPEPLAVRQQKVPGLYSALRNASLFAGSELNIEGVVLRGDTLCLFNRGNGVREGSRMPVNSTCELSWASVLALFDGRVSSAAVFPTNIQQYTLGDLDEVPLGFTDATTWRNAVLYSAAAEDSPDVVRDGPVSGSVIGIIPERGDLRWTPITDTDGRVVREKAEGVVVADEARGEVWMVADVDDEARSSELWKVRLTGPWLAD